MKCQSFSSQNNLNDTTQFSEDIMEIYIEKFTKIGHLNYVETFLNCFWMTQIFMDICAIDTPL